MDSQRQPGYRSDSATVSNTLAERASRRRALLDRPQQPWTGRLSFSAVRRGGRRYETVELKVRVDTIEVVLQGHPIGLADRDSIRLWLASPRQPLDFDDARLFNTGMALTLQVGERQYPIPERVASHLRMSC